MSDTQPKPFESFNARFLNPKEVGETFVTSPFLTDILAPNNTAILGPRGSGKTTLLKMLTLPALLSWPAPERDGVANNLEYLSAYIPSNLTWNADYRHFSGHVLPEDLSNLISVSLFRHGVLFALLDTWRDAARPEVKNAASLARFHLPIDDENEAPLIRDLARRWELDLPVSTISGLRSAISERLRLLQRLSVSSVHAPRTAAETIEKYPFLADHLLDDCTAFVGFLAEHYDFDHKLALCFDELEIAPDPIATAILQMPRSIDQRFLLKFSAAPYVGVSATLREATFPTQRQDYKFVLLSSFSSKETRAFSEDLFNFLAAKHRAAGNSTAILGKSLVDDVGPVGIDSGRYERNGAHQKRFSSLAQSDRTFEQYAADKGIDVSDLSMGSENERAALIRKIIWPVLIREEFLFRQETSRGSGKSTRRLRTPRSVSDIYTGSASLFAICEGNPRQIIGLVEPMLRSLRSPKDGVINSASAAVRRSLQTQLLEKMISAYFALLATVPTGQSIGGVSSLVDLISIIGGYFGGTVLGTNFNPDPVLSFVVDDKLSPSIKELVGRGINIGAFIIADVSRTNDTPYHLGDITGLRARLSNTFAPHFRLPLAGGRTVNLTTILSRSGAMPHPLLELFGEKL